MFKRYLLILFLFTGFIFPSEKNLKIKFTGDITHFSQISLNPSKKIKNSFSTDLEIEGKYKKRFKVFLHLENGKGKGLSKISDLTISGLNEDIFDTNYNLKVTELYVKSEIIDGFNITAGRLDPTLFIDENEFANDETTQFFSSVMKYNPTIDMPENGKGISFQQEISKKILISTLFMNLNFHSVESTFKIKNLNIRTYIWQRGRKSKGIGTNFDMNLKKSGFFFRYGKNLTQKREIRYFISTGLNIKGLNWKRKEDEIAIGTGISKTIEGKETIFESYYKLKIMKNIFITFDSEFIINPLYSKRKKLIVLGIRSFISF